MQTQLNLIGVSLFYLDGKRIGQIYHASLKTDCSSSNHNLFGKMSCICGRIETTKHCLFECNGINELRQEMMEEISPLCEPTIKLLYGDRELSDESLMRFFCCGSFLLFMFHVCLYFDILFVPCSIVITCLEKAGLLVLLLFFVFCHFLTWCPRSGVVLDCIDP